MSETLAIWFSTALVIALSLILLTGRGSFLVAGYNTMSKAKKARFNAPALCRFVGLVTLPMGILLPLLLIESIRDWYAWFYTAFVCVLAAIAIVYANVSSRFKR